MKIVEIFLKTDKKFTNRDGEKLRGYLGHFFNDIIEFHNHKDEITFNYASSIIQYRVVDGVLSILGINKGGKLLLENYGKINEIIINDEKISVVPEVKISETELSIADENIYRYKFETLWFALNSENFKKYKYGNLSLDRQLANNILEFFKLSGIRAEKIITAKGDFTSHKLTQKDTTIIGFIGEFSTNVNLPDNISLGKRKSIGLGRIKKI